MDKSAEETDDLKKPRSKWRRFLSFVFKHLLPIPFFGFVVFAGLVIGAEREVVFLVTTPALVAVLLVTIATRACLESLICLLLMSEAVCLAFLHEQSWPVVWTRVTVLQLLVGAALFFWLTVLRIRKRKFSTWVFCTEIITVLSFTANIYIHAAYWIA